MIVVDVNVVAYFLIEGEKTLAARDLFDRDPDWRVPMLWRHEFLNVLATFSRSGGATVTEALALWRQAVTIIGPLEQELDMEPALSIAIENRISAYDAQYIALAQRLQTVCVTEDQRLATAFPGLARSMQAFKTG